MHGCFPECGENIFIITTGNKYEQMLAIDAHSFLYFIDKKNEHEHKISNQERCLWKLWDFHYPEKISTMTVMIKVNCHVLAARLTWKHRKMNCWYQVAWQKAVLSILSPSEYNKVPTGMLR